MVLYRVMDLKIEPANVAIPTSMIDQDENGQLKFTFYIQTSDGFLLREQIMSAFEVRIVNNAHTCYWATRT